LRSSIVEYQFFVEYEREQEKEMIFSMK